VSLLLQTLGHEKREQSFRAWGDYRKEREYLALDITSVSSYSQLIDTVAWGCNRDGEQLPQVNWCLLLGETSRLPVFQMLYNGSLKDVRTLTTSLETAFHLGQKRLTLVLDKGFYSKNNLRFLFKSPIKAKFLLAVPFTVKTAQRLAAEFKPDIEKVRYAIALSRRESIQGAMKRIRWDDGEPVYAHVYYNMVKAGEVKNSLYGYVASLRDLALRNPLDSRYAHEFKEYLHIARNEKTGGYRVTIRHEVVEAEYRHAGWMVLISNQVKEPGEALKIYRAKDAVEKGFFRLKHDLDFHRLRIHSDTAMHGKVFVGFIALILMSHIHAVMANLELYKAWTLKELIRELEKLYVQYISGNRILYPVTKIQKEIFRLFNIDTPV
jgi:transposase